MLFLIVKVIGRSFILPTSIFVIQLQSPRYTNGDE